MLNCPACERAPELRLYTQQQLESHAVDEHEIRLSKSPAGWFCGNAEFTRVFYNDVMTALQAERRRFDAPSARQFPNPGWTI